MERIYIYLPLDGYLRQWAEKNLGNPIIFAAGSAENAIIKKNLVRSRGKEVQLNKDGCICILAPTMSGKRPTEYNYFRKEGISQLRESIETLFRIDMWYGIIPFLTGRDIRQKLFDWCKSKGITTEENYEAVRQKFYRIRKYYQQSGIILGKKYNKMSQTNP